MDPFVLCLALGPVAVYLTLFGMVNLARRPLLVSGARDTAALGLAVLGLVAIGPMRLFFPEAAAIQFGPYVWVFLMVLYGLVVAMVLLSMRPRLIVYNISADQLRPILADLVRQLDAESRWAGDNLVLPTLGVQLHVEAESALRNTSLVASGPRQDPAGWRRLEVALTEALRGFAVARNFRCLGLLVAGLALAVFLGWAVADNPGQTARSMFVLFKP